MLKELPEKWCIKDCTEVSLYASTEFPPCSNIVGPNFLHIDSTQHGSMQYNFYGFRSNGYTELTLEDFKRLVLKLPEYTDIRTRIKNLKI